MNCKDKKVKNAYLHTFDKILDDFLLNPSTILVISNTSIKNNITTSILYIHSSRNIIVKTIHHVINITSTKAKLFLIRCRINQVIKVPNIKNIIIITGTIHTARHIFNLSGIVHTRKENKVYRNWLRDR